MKLVWSPKFNRTVKKLARRKPVLLADLEAALPQLVVDPYFPALRTHKLGGDLQGCWACRVGYDFRLVFEFIRNARTRETEIHLLSVGTHDEVY